MRTVLTIALLLIACAALAQAPTYKNVGSMSQLMIDIIYPASDAIFYIERDPPKTDVQWNAFRTQALMVAESGNLLLLPGRNRNDEKWTADAKLLIDAGQAAYKAGIAKDMPAIVALNDQLYQSCVQCHKDYRPNYGKNTPLAK